MALYVCNSGNICRCIEGGIYVFHNIDDDNQKIIVKIYRQQNDQNYITENRILTTLTNAANHVNYENILTLLPHQGIELSPNEDVNLGADRLYFNYYQNGNLSKYIYTDFKHTSPSKDIVKYVAYKLIRAVRTIHTHNIAHCKLYINNIMLNNAFEPIIIHFMESIDNINDINLFAKDYRDLAQILLNLMVVKDVIIRKEGNKLKFLLNRKNQTEKNFWNSISLEYQEFEEIKEIIYQLMDDNLNVDNLLNSLQNVGQNQQIQNEAHSYFQKLLEDIKNCKEGADYEKIDFFNCLGKPDDCNLQLFDKNNNNNNYGMKECSDTSEEKICSIIRQTYFKPNRIFLEYLTIKAENLKEKSNFFKNYMKKLYLELCNINNFPGFFIEREKLTDEYSSFYLDIKELENKNCKDEETIENNILTINIELIEYIESINKECNIRTFYLLFNYKEGEIYYYYQYVKLFKKKAKEVLKELFDKK